MAVAKELRKLTADPPEGIKVLLNEDDVTDITADISGPGAAAAGRSARAAAWPSAAASYSPSDDSSVK